MFVLLFTRLALQGIVCYTFEVYCRAVMSLPCVKGGGARKRDGGIVKVKSSRKTIPQSTSLTAPFTQGSLWFVCPKVHLLFLTSIAFVDTKAMPRTRRGDSLF